ncbi:hypothetical protein BX666DRAFT_2031009 [Dichotomocladium elegans]|nr:hypothetical protein BX666DRAFT_2031009 [Dichotomocladium elegans]
MRISIEEYNEIDSQCFVQLSNPLHYSSGALSGSQFAVQSTIRYSSHNRLQPYHQIPKPNMNPTIEKVIEETIESASSELRYISLQIHEHPELGDREYKASRLLTSYLEKKGFKVTRGVADLPTAFVAEYSNGQEGRRIGFCSEYDALPGIGHACGHNLIAIAGVACALATKALLEKQLIKGKVVLFGTPAEESSNGKIQLVQRGEVDSRVDAAMMHPAPTESVYTQLLALDQLVIEFFGKASHAGMAPWDGVNALDALMQAWNNISMMRQQLIAENRVHGVILNGGKSANVIPDYASAKFFARSRTKAQLAVLKTKIENCFNAAAVATGCKVKLSWSAHGAVDDVFQNEPMGEIYKKFMTAEGVEFLPRSVEETIVSASTDMGNISYVVPTLHPGFGLYCKALNHTPEFTAEAATEEAHRYTLRAARCLSKMAATVYTDDKVYQDVRDYFDNCKP